MRIILKKSRHREENNREQNDKMNKMIVNVMSGKEVIRWFIAAINIIMVTRSKRRLREIKNKEMTTTGDYGRFTKKCM